MKGEGAYTGSIHYINLWKYLCPLKYAIQIVYVLKMEPYSINATSGTNTRPAFRQVSELMHRDGSYGS